MHHAVWSTSLLHGFTCLNTSKIFCLFPFLRTEFPEEKHINMWRLHHVSIMGVIQGDKRPMTVGRRQVVENTRWGLGPMKYNSIWESEEVDLGGKWRGHPETTSSSGSWKAKKTTLLCMCFTTKWNTDDSILYASIFVLVSNLRNITVSAWKYASMLKKCNQLKKSQVNG